MKVTNSKTRTPDKGTTSTKRPFLGSIAIMSLAISNIALATNINGETISLKSFQNFKAASDPGKAIEGQYIVILKDQYVGQQAMKFAGKSLNEISNQALRSNYKKRVVDEITLEVKSRTGAYVMRKYHNVISGMVMKLNNTEVQELLMDSRIAYVEQDQLVSINALQNNATWGLDRIDQPSLPLNSNYSYANDGTGVRAYIVDTGMDVSHSNFQGRTSAGADFVNDGNGTDDCNGHGTHVAGTIGSATYGVAKNVTVIPVRVLDCAGSGSVSGVVGGIDWVGANAIKPAVANMSLGGGASAAIDTAVKNAIAKGITFVVAAGNDNSDACVGSPNSVPEAITVGSSTNADIRSSFSNWGSCVDVFAPGSNITSTWPGGGTNTISGTSMASPHVAGAVALYLQGNPSATPGQVSQAIIANAVTGKLTSLQGSPNRLLQIAVSTVVPPPPPPSGSDVLENGVSQDALSAVRGDEIVYTFEVSAGASNASVSISGGTGDADLYVKLGSVPSDTAYDCRPYASGNNESCALSGAGTYYVRVKAYAAFAGVSLIGQFTEASGGLQPISKKLTNVSVGKNQWVRETISLQDGYSTLVVRMSGGSGDADLYLAVGGQATLTQYQCRPFALGNEEVCTIDAPSAGDWSIGIHGYTAASGISLDIQAMP